MRSQDPETRPFLTLPFWEGLAFTGRGLSRGVCRGTIHPLPGLEVIFHLALPSQGKGSSLWGYRPYTWQAPWPTPQAFQEALGTANSPCARRGLHEEGGHGRVGASVCTGLGHRLFWGRQHGCHRKPPERLKPCSEPRGAHPRLSLSEATGLHPPWPAWSLPQVGGLHTFFPAESTCTKIDLKMLIRQDRGRMKTNPPNPVQGPALWVCSKEDPCLLSICPPGCLTVTASWRDGTAYVQLSHLSPFWFGEPHSRPGHDPERVQTPGLPEHSPPHAVPARSTPLSCQLP